MIGLQYLLIGEVLRIGDSSDESEHRRQQVTEKAGLSWLELSTERVKTDQIGRAKSRWVLKHNPSWWAPEMISTSRLQAMSEGLCE